MGRYNNIIVNKQGCAGQRSMPRGRYGRPPRGKRGIGVAAQHQKWYWRFGEYGRRSNAELSEDLQNFGPTRALIDVAFEIRRGQVS